MINADSEGKAYGETLGENGRMRIWGKGKGRFIN